MRIPAFSLIVSSLACLAATGPAQAQATAAADMAISGSDSGIANGQLFCAVDLKHAGTDDAARNVILVILLPHDIGGVQVNSTAGSCRTGPEFPGAGGSVVGNVICNLGTVQRYATASVKLSGRVLAKRPNTNCSYFVYNDVPDGNHADNATMR